MIREARGEIVDRSITCMFRLLHCIEAAASVIRRMGGSCTQADKPEM